MILSIGQKGFRERYYRKVLQHGPVIEKVLLIEKAPS